MFHEAKGDSVQIARMYMDSLLVESRVVGAVRPDTSFRFLGETFEMPIMTAALSHLDLVSMAEGAKQAGACVSIGMGGNEEFGAVLSTGAKVMKIIKPYADEKEIMSRIAFAEANGALAVGMDGEHAVDVDDADLAILRDRGCVAVHNPASNMKLASGAAPVERLLGAGVPVALGTDGPASNNAQDMVREMWLAALLGKLASGDPTAVCAQTALDMATRHGAAAIHDPLAGSLEPGKHADFFALDLRGPGMQPVHNVVSNAVYAATGLENRLTVVDGRATVNQDKCVFCGYCARACPQFCIKVV